jgi:uncharacterized integral membrane protein
MKLPTSPRVRRRLMWFAVVGAALLVLVGIAVLLPSRGTDTRAKRPPTPPTFGGEVPTASVPFDTTPDPEAERRRGDAEAAVHPLADTFVRAVIARRDLADAYALLSPELQSRYSRPDWQSGRDLPFGVKHHERYSGSSVVFSDASMVGLVASLTPPNAVSGETQPLLLAMRFEKSSGRWSLHYVHEGHGSRYVTASSYSPSGFIPGTRSETRWTWLILVGGLLALVALAVLAERALSPRSRTA